MSVTIHTGDARDRARRVGLWAIAGYVATIPAANWFLGHVGWCQGTSPCLLPVGFDLWAPSGVVWAGLAFSLRDAVQEHLGRWWAVAAILVGALLSLAVAAPFVAAASALAFLVSELADFAVYTPLRRRGMVRAVAASNVVGAVVDSVLFLAVAGFPISLWLGLVVGKAWMILPAVVVLAWLRRRRPSLVGVTA